MLRKLVFSLLILLFTISCLDPYNLKIEGYDELLVVDGMITDENISHRVTLLRSTSDINQVSPYEMGASVYVSDSKGQNYYFAEFSPGRYQSDSTSLKVEVGEMYTLHVETADGSVYQSEACEVLPKTSIDQVYFKKNKAWDVTGQYEDEGISFYIDGKGAQGTYVKWLFEEDWKFRTAYPEMFSVTEDNNVLPIYPVENMICWKHNSSININVHSFGNQTGGEIKGKEINFIPTGLTDRMNMRYSIRVKQISISKGEYEYWRKLSESTEDVGDVFGKQPFSIVGNIKNVENGNEPVLGYFQTGSVVSQRMYVNFDDIKAYDLPFFDVYQACRLDTFIPDGLAYSSLYEIYDALVINGPYRLYQPLYGDASPNPIGLLLSSLRCSDCSVSGEVTPPDFWEE